MQEKIFFNLYRFLTSKEGVLFRALLFIVLTLVLLLFVDEPSVLLRILPLYLIFLLQELFIHKKLERIHPEKNVNDANDLIDATVFDIRSELSSSKSAFTLVESLLISKKGKFIRERISPELKLTDANITKDALLDKASALVKALEGKYITSLDIITAYLLLQEESARILQDNNLNEKDLLTILYWARKKFHIGEVEPPAFLFHGSGAFDSLVYGWTPETKNYTSDFTTEVLSLDYEPKIIGREKDYREFVESLSKGSASNVLLVGDPGVGKTTLVMKFAHDAYKGLLTKKLKNKRIYFLFVDRLLSGAGDKGEIESRIGNIFTEVSHSGNIIVFIENIENIFGGGGGFEFDMSGAIQAYLESNRVQIIGTINPQAYKDSIATKPSVQSLFSEIDLDAPDPKIATFMLIEEVNIREKMSKAIVTYGAIKEIVESSDLYSPDSSLPGSAVKLLEDVMVRSFNSGKNLITRHEVSEMIKDKTGVKLSAPTEEEKNTLLAMEETLHKSLIGQDEAVSSVSNALRRLRSGLRKKQGPIASFLFLGPTGVGKTTTAKLLAREYFGSEDRMIRVDMSEYQTQDSIKKLLGEMPGEQSFKNSFVDKISETPFSIVLLDEFEKAHPQLLDVFLQVLDEGFVTNNKGKKISFTNAIIIATSNAGSQFIREKIESGGSAVKDELIDYILTKSIFKPELVNRFDDVVVFHPLSKEQVVKITELMLTDLKDKLMEQFIDISFSDNAIDKISIESFDQDFGARNVRRYIEENIENLVSRMILEGKISKGERFIVGVGDNGDFIIEQ